MCECISEFYYEILSEVMLEVPMGKFWGSDVGSANGEVMGK